MSSASCEIHAQLPDMSRANLIKYHLYKSKPKNVVVLTKLFIILNRDPVRKVQNATLMKALVMWRDKYPLMEKCNEIGRQIQERMRALSVVRECYLRDVVAIKHHLERILLQNDWFQKQYAINRENIKNPESALEAQERGQEILEQFSEEAIHVAADLQSIPSANLRNFIEECKNSPDSVSAR